MTSLNYEELDKLFKTPCKYEVLRRASIFAVLSGLRRGDILALDWKDYEKDYHGKPTFRIVTKKTGAVSHHPVSAEAMEACGPGTTAQYICNSDALARKAVDNLHLQRSRIKRFWSKIRKVFSIVMQKV